MILDSEQQRQLILKCVQVTASTVRVDASDEALSGHAAVVQLRRDVEMASIVAPVQAPADST